MEETFRFPEPPETRTELANWQSYLSGIIDGALKTELQGNRGHIYCTINNPQLRRSFQGLFGGKLNMRCWELYGVENILGIYKEYSSLFELSKIRAFEFYYFFKTLESIQKGHDKDQHYNFEQFQRIKSQHVFKSTEFSFPHLVGYIDTGHASIFVERKPPRRDGTSRNRLHIEIKHLNESFILGIHQNLGGQIGNTFSDVGNKIHFSRFSGSKAVTFIKTIYPHLHFRKAKIDITMERLLKPSSKRT